MRPFFNTIIILLICTFSTNLGHAQSGIRELIKEETEEQESNRKDKFRIGYTPSALINSYVGLQINGAYAINDKFQFNMEAGWIFTSHSLYDQPSTGFRVRPMARMYLTKEDNFAFQIGLGYNYRKTTTQRSEYFSDPINNASGIYDFEQDRIVRGFVVGFGIELWLSNHSLLEIGVGFGPGKINNIDKGGPPLGNRGSGDFLEYDDPGINRFPIIFGNFRIQRAF